MNEIQTLIVVLILVILLIAVGILYFFLLSKRRLRKLVKSLEEKKGEMNNLVGESISGMLNRFYFISQSNEEFIKYFEDFRSKRDMIVEKYDNDFHEKVKKVQDFYSQHRQKLAKIALQEALECYSSYRNQVQELEKEMNVYLQEDDNCRAQAVPYQRRFREVREIYLTHKEELELVSDSLQKVFERLEIKFEEFEKLASSANYKEALEKLPIMDKVLSALEDALDKLPFLCARLGLVLPQKVKEIEDQYQNLEEQKYPLHHLKVNTTLENIKQKMQQLSQQLAQFSYKNVAEEMDAIERTLKILSDAFQEEMESKTFFDNNQEKIYEDEYQIECRFMHLRRVLPDYKKIYWIQERYLDTMVTLQNDVSSLGAMKRELDNYIHSSYMQPYSIIVQRMKDILNEMERMQKVMNELEQYLKSLKTDSEEAYRFLNEKFLSLKQLEKTLRNMNLPHYSSTLKNDFAQCYSHLENIGMLIKMQPINVEAINTALLKAKEIEEKLKENILFQEQKMHESEDAVVYANQYRQEFYDVRQALNRAEDAFFEGDFTTTLDEAISIEKKMNPEVGK